MIVWLYLFKRKTLLIVLMHKQSICPRCNKAMTLNHDDKLFFLDKFQNLNVN